MLRPIQLDELLSRLADHALEENLHPEVLLAQVEKEIVRHALELEGDNQVKTARRLGMHRNTVRRKMLQFGLPQRKDQMNSRGDAR